MSGWLAGGAVAGGAAGIAGIVGAVKQAQAIRRAANRAAAYEDLKFQIHFQDSLHQNRILNETNQATYVARGIDASSGSPLAVEVNVASEMMRDIDRFRREMEMRKEVIRADAKAGRASAIIGGVSSGLNSAATVTGILGRA